MGQNANLVEYYQQLLIIQYIDKAKAQAHIAAIVNAEMIFDVIVAVRDGFNILTAVGAQLDIIGKYEGISRTISGVDFTRTWFGYGTYTDLTPIFTGYSTYTTSPLPDAQYMRYQDTEISLFDLNDVEYQQFLNLASMKNIGFPSLQQLDQFIYDVFGSVSYATDNLDGSISCHFQSTQTRLATIANSLKLLPKAAGVAMSIAFDA